MVSIPVQAMREAGLRIGDDIVVRARHRHLRLPDAMVLAAATPAGRDLLTYDTRLAKLAT